MDFSDYSLEELEIISKDLQKAIQNRESVIKKEALSHILKTVLEKDLKISEVIEFLEQQSKQRKKVKAKYRHPEDNTLTWTGRGRKPVWVEEQLSKGNDLESLKIKGE